ncbi:MAG: hypothetical protein M5U18_09775 [Dehalococcoidia bacterium]|nr:hypothetical protein [Dehalococcoidia bacterium]
MPIPMPTVVAKGSTALALDARYSTPEGRWASLQALRAAAASGQTGMDAAATTGSLPPNEISHLKDHWFDEKKDHWMVLKPQLKKSWLMPGVYFEYEPKQPELDYGARVLTAGLIQALECSLGLSGPNDEPPLKRDSAGDVQKNANGLDMVDTAAANRCLPIDVYWVCGKLDGFEVQVSWNEQQVTCFILTPQVAAAADVFQQTYPAGDLTALKTAKGKTKGMLVTTTLKGASAPGTIILARDEGGVNAHPLPPATTTGGTQ